MRGARRGLIDCGAASCAFARSGLGARAAPVRKGPRGSAPRRRPVPMPDARRGRPLRRSLDVGLVLLFFNFRGRESGLRRGPKFPRAPGDGVERGLLLALRDPFRPRERRCGAAAANRRRPARAFSSFWSLDLGRFVRPFARSLVRRRRACKTVYVDSHRIGKCAMGVFWTEQENGAPRSPPSLGWLARGG